MTLLLEGQNLICSKDDSGQVIYKPGFKLYMWKSDLHPFIYCVKILMYMS